MQYDDGLLLLRESDIITPDYPTEAEIIEGKQWLKSVSFDERMTKNAILYGWEQGHQSAKQAVYHLIEEGLFNYEQVLYFIAQQDKCAKIIDGEE